MSIDFLALLIQSMSFLKQWIRDVINFNLTFIPSAPILYLKPVTSWLKLQGFLLQPSTLSKKCLHGISLSGKNIASHLALWISLFLNKAEIRLMASEASKPPAKYTAHASIPLNEFHWKLIIDHEFLPEIYAIQVICSLHSTHEHDLHVSDWNWTEWYQVQILYTNAKFRNKKSETPCCVLSPQKLVTIKL